MPFTLAIISDIHSNVIALEAVLLDIKEQFPEVTELISPGDIAGYGPDPSETTDRILAEKMLTVVTKGNHDHAVGGGGRDIANFDTYIGNFNEHAQKAIKWQAEVLSPEEKTFLYQLPNSRTYKHEPFDLNIAIIHGSPEYPLDEYILPNTPQQKDLFPFMELFELEILFLGHTHIPFVDTMTSESGQELLMCNPGSVGQPRDNDPRASYAVVDLGNISAKICRVDYDIDEVQKRIFDAGLPEYLAERLQKGK